MPQIIDFITHFHFIRPYWLIILPISLIMTWYYAKQNHILNKWSSYIDADLLAQLIKITSTKPADKRWFFILACCFILTSIALAGPSFKKIPQPVINQKENYFIVLDLSLSMSATDLSPDRLTRAKFKINDILTAYKGSQFALIAYSEDAYTLVPPTADVEAIQNILAGININIMPKSGNNLLSAIEEAKNIIERNQIKQSQLIVLTDGVKPSAISSITETFHQIKGANLGIIALGTAEGSPIKTQNGLVRDTNDQLVLTKLDLRPLQELAQSTGGVLALLTADNQDIHQIIKPQISFIHDLSPNEIAKHGAAKFDQWEDAGIWLMLILAPLVLSLFRKGWLLTVYLTLCLNAVQARPSMAFDVKNWLGLGTSEGEQALVMQDYAKAQTLLKDPIDQGIAAYFDGNKEQALGYFKQSDQAISHYNQGIIYLEQQDYSNAIQSFHATLDKLNPEQKQLAQDAKAKLKAAEVALKQQSELDQQNHQQKPGAEHQLKDEQKQQESSATDKQNADSRSADQLDKRQNDQAKEAAKTENPDHQNQPRTSDKTIQAKPERRNKSKQASEERNSADSQQLAEQSTQEQPIIQQSSKAELTGNRLKNTDEQESYLQKDSKYEQYQQEQYRQKQIDQWLSSIPDDPGELLRKKLLLKYQQKRHSQAYIEPSPMQPDDL